MSDSHSNQSVTSITEEMSNSSIGDSSCSLEHESGSAGTTSKKKTSHGTKHSKHCSNSKGSNRSSVSSMASCGGAGSIPGAANSVQNIYHQNNLNHALALVTNQLEREQKKNDQEATRKLTLLRQRKISAVLKVSDQRSCSS